jgi:phytoene desaturase
MTESNKSRGSKAARVAIVGAGIGGLSAAVVLAARGFEVKIFEAGTRAGGKIGVGHYDGVEFDTGPSVLTMPEVFEEIFSAAGTSLKDELELVESTPHTRYHYPDGLHLDIHRDLGQTIENIGAQLGSHAAGQFADFMRYSEGIWKAAAPNFIFSQAPSLGSMTRLGWAALPAMWGVDPFNSMWESIQKRIDSKHLRHLLARYATYNGSDPRRAPATLNCISWVELGKGGWGVGGGIYELVRALERCAARLGVDFCFNSPVRRIQTLADGAGVCGVETDAATWRCDAAVINADVAHLLDELLPDPAPKSLRRTAPASMSGWTCVIQARRRPAEQRPAHQVIFPADYLEEFRDIFDRDRPPQDPTIYLCAQEKAHRRRGWTEHEAIFAMTNAPPEPASASRDAETWQRLHHTVRQKLRRVELIAADDAPIWERTPSGLADIFPGTRGAIYGMASNTKFAAFQRPANRVKEIRGLYLAGGSAHPGGGVPLCAQSGLLAARALQNDAQRPR